MSLTYFFKLLLIFHILEEIKTLKSVAEASMIVLNHDHGLVSTDAL